MILFSFLAVFLTWWLQDSERKHREDDTNVVGQTLTLIRHAPIINKINAISTFTCTNHILFTVLFFRLWLHS